MEPRQCVAPLAGAGIEIYTEQSDHLTARVAPLAGAGIEIPRGRFRPPGTGSPLSQGRELKCIMAGVVTQDMLSPLSQGRELKF